MQSLLAIITLTWKAAFRYRLFWVILALLLVAVVGLPALVKDDGTASGFAQILLTYTLYAVCALLGLCTLWLGCGTLAREVEDCQIQMIAVKPIPRWKIWLGKWLGLVALNAVLLALSGASVYVLLQWRANHLSAVERDKLFNEVLVARGSAHEKDLEPEIRKQSQEFIRKQLENHKLDGTDLALVQKQVYEQMKAEYQLVPSGGTRIWQISLGSKAAELKGRPLFLRVKFNTPQISGLDATFKAMWQVGLPGKTQIWQTQTPESLAPDTTHEIRIPPDLIDADGNLDILFVNVNETALLFPLDDGMEVLYREGGFLPNFARALGVILCWMAMLAALGLAASSLMTFPVAAFFSVAMLVLVMSSSTINSVVTDGTIMGYSEESGKTGHSMLDIAAVPLFRVILSVINLVQKFSPIDSLGSGRLISWEDLGRAFFQIVVVISGGLGGLGMIFFTRRELATAQGTH